LSEILGNLREMVRQNETTRMAVLRKSEIELLWVQFEELIAAGKHKDAKTRLQLLQRMYQTLAKTMPKNKPSKKR
jgi:hypothetical protein